MSCTLLMDLLPQALGAIDQFIGKTVGFVSAGGGHLAVDVYTQIGSSAVASSSRIERPSATPSPFLRQRVARRLSDSSRKGSFKHNNVLHQLKVAVLVDHRENWRHHDVSSHEQRSLRK